MNCSGGERNSAAKISGVACLSVGIVLAAVAAICMIKRSLDKPDVAQTTANITDIKRQISRGTLRCALMYEFRIDDKIYHSPRPVGNVTNNSQNSQSSQNSDSANRGTMPVYNSDYCYKVKDQSVIVSYYPKNPNRNYPGKEIGASSISSIVGELALFPVSLLLIAIGIYINKIVARTRLNQSVDINRRLEEK